MQAVVHDDLRIAKLLLERGANPDNYDVDSGDTPCASCLPSCSCVNRIVPPESQTGCRCPSLAGNSCLHMAVSRRNLDMVKLLLDYNANISHQDKSPVGGEHGFVLLLLLLFLLLIVPSAKRAQNAVSTGFTPIGAAFRSEVFDEITFYLLERFKDNILTSAHASANGW